MYTSKSSKPILLLVDIVCLLLASYVHDSARQLRTYVLLPNAVQKSDPAGGGTVVHPTQAHAVHAPARALLHGARVQCVRTRVLDDGGGVGRCWPSPAAKRTCSLRFQSPLSTRLEWNEMKCI